MCNHPYRSLDNTLLHHLDMVWTAVVITQQKDAKVCRGLIILARGWIYVLTNGYEPHQCNLQHHFGSGFGLAVLDWFLDGNVAIQRNGA